MEKYYCTKCRKYHHRGKIYTNHLNFKRKEVKVDDSQLIDPEDVNFEDLSPIAKRQILSLIKRMKKNYYPEFYKNRIMNVIKYENKNN